MSNVVLERKLAERGEAVAQMESILGAVDGRDLTDAETQVLDATRKRIGELDDQIRPLEEYERVKGQHQQSVAEISTPATSPAQSDRLPARARRVDGLEPAIAYRSAGEFVVDYLRARGVMERPSGPIDTSAQARVQAAYEVRAVADQKTTDTPGLLPTLIVGQVVNLIDSNRPFISSIGGAKALAGIAGTTFNRPKITQHTTVGQQTTGANEKTQLSSQKMTITSVAFNKTTYGGTVDISRQDIDWTDPGAWDILVRDLAQVYAVATETAASAAFKAAATATPVVVATNDLKGWTLALYTAAMHAYQAGFMMPDRIWCSLDVWAALGSLVDVARVAIPQDLTREDGAPGTSTVANFSGDMLGVPRIVVPTFAAGTCIVGNSSLFEVYEQVIGLLSVIEPSILGVQVAYGGYVAFGALHGAALVPLTAPAGMPTSIETETEPEPEAAPAAKSSK